MKGRHTFIYLVPYYNHCDLGHGLYLNEGPWEYKFNSLIC